MAKIIPLKRAPSPNEKAELLWAEEQPRKLSAHDAMKLIKWVAQDSKSVFIVRHAKTRQRQRQISRRQIINCLQKGSVSEGPFVNNYGNWQVDVMRCVAGEEVTCGVAIEWAKRLVVITAF